MTLSAEELAELAGYGAVTVHEAIGGIGALDPAIRPLDPSTRIGALARTVEAAPGDNLTLHVALAGSLGGRLLVVDVRGSRDAGPPWPGRIPGATPGGDFPSRSVPRSPRGR